MMVSEIVPLPLTLILALNRTAESQAEVKHGLPFLFSSQDPVFVEGFANAMTASGVMRFGTLAEKFPFSKYSSLTDIGGSAGVLCCEVAKRHPNIKYPFLPLCLQLPP